MVLMTTDFLIQREKTTDETVKDAWHEYLLIEEYEECYSHVTWIYLHQWVYNLFILDWLFRCLWPFITWEKPVWIYFANRWVVYHPAFAYTESHHQEEEEEKGRHIFWRQTGASVQYHMVLRQHKLFFKWVFRKWNRILCYAPRWKSLKDVFSFNRVDWTIDKVAVFYYMCQISIRTAK